MKKLAPIKAKAIREGEDAYLFRYLEEDIDVIDPYRTIFPPHISVEDWVEIVEPCGMHCCGFRRLGLESEAEELVYDLAFTILRFMKGTTTKSLIP